MRIVKLKNLKRGFAFKPTIFVPDIKDVVLLTAYIEHEKVHYDSQGLFPVIWLIRYNRNKEFRFDQEKKAYEAEANYLHKVGRTINYDALANIMATEYNNMCSLKETKEFTERLKEKHEKMA